MNFRGDFPRRVGDMNAEGDSPDKVLRALRSELGCTPLLWEKQWDTPTDGVDQRIGDARPAQMEGTAAPPPAPPLPSFIGAPADCAGLVSQLSSPDCGRRLYAAGGW